ncbi:MAG: multidrug effflux MFS transporter [Rhodospirillales bacterium]
MTAGPAVDARRGVVLYVLLTLLLALQPASTDLYLPSLPDIRAAFGVTTGTVQLTLSGFTAVFAVASLVYGPLSDRYGRRPVLRAALALYAVGTLGCVLAQDVGQLVAFRMVQAAGASAAPTLARAVVRDLHDRDRGASVLSYMTFAMTFVPILAPPLGGVLVDLFGWRSAFVALLAFGAVVLVGTWTVLPETNAFRDPGATRIAPLIAGYRSLLSSRTYLGYALCPTVSYSGIFAYISGSSFVLIETVGLSPVEYGIAFGVTVSGYLLGTFLGGRFATRIGTLALVRTGAMLAFAGGATAVASALTMPPSVVAIVLPIWLYNTGAGFLLPGGFAGCVAAFPRIAGTASALAVAMQLTAGTIVGLLVGAFHDGSAMPHSLAALLAGTVGILATRGLLRRERAVAP